jgi:hypothetical protein
MLIQFTVGNYLSFKDTTDYGRKIGEKPIRVSNDWWVWKIGRQIYGSLCWISN